MHPVLFVIPVPFTETKILIYSVFFSITVALVLGIYLGTRASQHEWLPVDGSSEAVIGHDLFDATRRVGIRTRVPEHATITPDPIMGIAKIELDLTLFEHVCAVKGNRPIDDLLRRQRAGRLGFAAAGNQHDKYQEDGRFHSPDLTILGLLGCEDNSNTSAGCKSHVESSCE